MNFFLKDMRINLITFNLLIYFLKLLSLLMRFYIYFAHDIKIILNFYIFTLIVVICKK